MRERPLSMNVDGGSLTLGGSIDEGSVAALRTLLAGLSEGGEAVVVDLTGVDYLPSFAIGVLAKARSRARAQGASFDLVAPEGCTAHRVLQIAAIPYLETLDPTSDDETAVDGAAVDGAAVDGAAVDGVSTDVTGSGAQVSGGGARPGAS